MKAASHKSTPAALSSRGAVGWACLLRSTFIERALPRTALGAGGMNPRLVWGAAVTFHQPLAIDLPVAYPMEYGLSFRLRNPFLSIAWNDAYGSRL
jgi:hypothetical protein